MSTSFDDLVVSFLKSLPDRAIEATTLWLEYEEGKRKDLAALKRLLHTVKGEAHMLSLEKAGDLCERLEDVVVLVHQLGGMQESTGTAVLEGLEALTFLGGTEPGNFDIQPVLDGLFLAHEELRAELEANPEKKAQSAPPLRPSMRSSSRAPTGLESDDPDDGDRRIENAVRVDEVQPMLHDLRRLYEEHLELQPRLRELQRILRAIVAEMDPSLPPAVLGEQVVKTLGAAAELERRLSALRSDWSANTFATGLAIEQLAESTRKAAMVSVHRLRSALQLSVRTTAKALDKEVQLRFEGDAYIDAGIAQRLEPALLHAVRNSIDHGIEAPAQRERLGKPRFGTVDIHVEQESSNVVVTVQDDGAGVDIGAVRAKFDLPADTPPRKVLRHLLRSGVSTRDVTTAISGRGVGLDVVAREVSSVGGNVELSTELGKGFCLTLTMPTVLRADLIVPLQYGAHRLALPARNVETFVKLEEIEETTSGAFARIEHERSTELLPVFAMSTVFGEEPVVKAGTRAVLVRHHELRFLLTVDGYGNPKPLPFQPAHELCFRSSLVSAVAPSPEGVRVLLDVAALAEVVAKVEVVAGIKPRRTARIVVVEDAPVARELLCGILRSFGLDVIEASHGGEGLARIRENEPDLVLTDVEMPFIGGIEMIRELRGETRFAELPVIVLTTDTREPTRRAARALNVVGFLSKQRFVEHELRELVDRCLEGRL
jgi:two-component system chemotaxis sensor kinase CheA